MKFIVCVKKNADGDLTVGKIYPVITRSTKTERKDNLLRVIDDGGEDYLYPKNYFESIKLPKKLQSVMAKLRKNKLPMPCMLPKGWTEKRIRKVIDHYEKEIEK